MELKINNKIIDASIKDILSLIKEETKKPLFRDIIDKGKNLVVTCPAHKGGQENHPSCRIFQDELDPNVEYGFVHCFSCGYKVPLYKMIADCFDESEEFGKEWLAERFGNIFIERHYYLPQIILDEKPYKRVLPESLLDNFDYYHPYMFQRKLTKEVIDKFRIGYDKDADAITFPVWDDKGQLVMITSRSTTSKFFHIDENVEKPVYLLNFIKRENISTVYVAESQINTLTLWSWGYPAIGLFGTGSGCQYDILKKSGIRSYILCLDGDEAGDKGIERFKRSMPSDVLISVKKIPRDKDVNDLTKEEFDLLETL